MGFWSGFGQGLQPVGPNIAQAMMLRRARKKEDADKAQRDILARIGLVQGMPGGMSGERLFEAARLSTDIQPGTMEGTALNALFSQIRQQAQPTYQEEEAGTTKQYAGGESEFTPRIKEEEIKPPSTAGLPEGWSWKQDPAGKWLAKKIETVGDIGFPQKTETEKADKTFEQTALLRREFFQQSGDFFQARDGYARVKISADNPSAAGDVALLYGYMKLIDPRGAVREGDYATAEETASIPQRVVGYYNKALTGERLTPEVREDFRKSAEKQYQAVLRSHRALRGYYINLARRKHFDPEDAAPDLSYEASGQESRPDVLSTAEETEYQGLLKEAQGNGYKLPQEKVSRWNELVKKRQGGV